MHTGSVSHTRVHAHSALGWSTQSNGDPSLPQHALKHHPSLLTCAAHNNSADTQTYPSNTSINKNTLQTPYTHLLRVRVCQRPPGMCLRCCVCGGCWWLTHASTQAGSGSHPADTQRERDTESVCV